MAWETALASALLTADANFEAFNDGTDAIVIDLTPGEVVDLNFSIAGDVGEVDDVEIQVLVGSRIINGSALGSVQSASAMDVAVGDNQADDYYRGMYFLMTTGDETKDFIDISNYVSSTDELTLLRALSGSPTAAELYNIYHMRALHQFIITAELTYTEDLPQNDGLLITGVPFVVARARTVPGGTDAHPVLMTYAKNAVSL